MAVNFLTDKDRNNLEAKIETKSDKSHKHTPEGIGAADRKHQHAATDISSGEIPLDRGGTGADTANGAVHNLSAVRKRDVTTKGTGAIAASTSRSDLLEAAVSIYIPQTTRICLIISSEGDMYWVDCIQLLMNDNLNATPQFHRIMGSSKNNNNIYAMIERTDTSNKPTYEKYDRLYISSTEQATEWPNESGVSYRHITL